MQNKCCGLSWRRQIKSILVVSQSSSRKELLAQTLSGGMDGQQSKIQISSSGAESGGTIPDMPAKNEVELAKQEDKSSHCAKKIKINKLFYTFSTFLMVWKICFYLAFILTFKYPKEILYFD